MPVSITQDFQHEFHIDQRVRMRKRLMWYLIVSIVFSLLLTVPLGFGVYMAWDIGEVTPRSRLQLINLTSSLILSVFSISAYVVIAFWLRKREPSRELAVAIVYWLIVIVGIVSIVAPVMTLKIGAAQLDIPEAGVRLIRSGAAGALFGILFAHFFAAVFIPWTPRESLRPIAPLVAVGAATLAYAWWGSWVVLATLVALSPLIAVPGTLLCWWKHSRYRDKFTRRMLGLVYGEMKQELSTARQIHDAMFPPDIVDGPVHVRYAYEPMRQIGGDYVFVRRAQPPDRAIDVVVIDVTGHGVTAALTVNRLHGEVERLLAERPEAGPDELLRGLNRYLHITLAEHSVYATAVVFRADPDADELRYASAGHPPAFLATSDAQLHQLDSTTFLLGVCAPDDFNPEERTLRFTRGDRVIAYTDGATEALNSEGRQLRVEGLTRILMSLDPRRDDWPTVIQSHVEHHRDGPARDDTLIIEIKRPLE